MKKSLLILVFICFSAICFADMTIVQKIQSPPMMGQPAQNTILTIYIKGAKARMETQGNSRFQIVDLQADKIYMVNTDDKTAMAMPLNMAKQMGDILGKMGKGQAPPKMSTQKTGKTETINGYKCEEYITTMTGIMDMTSDQWVTEDIDTSEFEAFKGYAEGFTKMFGQDPKDLPKGITIRSQFKMKMMGQDVSGSTEVQSITKGPVPDSMFQIPQGFNVQEMPAMEHH